MHSICTLILSVFFLFLPADIYAEEIKALEQACSGGNGEQCYHLAIQYRDGVAVPKDDIQSIVYFKKACTNNYLQGCTETGKHYVSSTAMEQNKTKAINYFKKDCNTKTDQGCLFLLEYFPSEYKMQMGLLDFRTCISLSIESTYLYDALEDKLLQSKSEVEKVEKYYQTLIGIKKVCPDEDTVEASQIAKKVEKALILLKAKP